MTVRNYLTDLSASIPVGAISASGTPSNTTYLRGDGAWATAGGPGGANTNIQFNDSGSFSGSDWFTFRKLDGLITSKGYISGYGEVTATSKVTFPFIDYPGNVIGPGSSSDRGIGIIEGTDGNSCANLKLVGLDGDPATQTYATALHETSGNRNRMSWYHWNKDTLSGTNQITISAEGDAGEVGVYGEYFSWINQAMPVNIMPKWTTRTEIASLNASPWYEATDYLYETRPAARFGPAVAGWAGRVLADEASAHARVELGINEVGSPGTDPTTWAFHRLGKIAASVTSFTDVDNYTSSVQINGTGNGSVVVGESGSTLNGSTTALKVGEVDGEIGLEVYGVTPSKLTLDISGTLSLSGTTQSASFSLDDNATYMKATTGRIVLQPTASDESSPVRVLIGAYGNSDELPVNYQSSLLFNHEGLNMGGIGVTNTSSQEISIVDICGVSGDRNFRFIADETLGGPKKSFVLGPFFDNGTGWGSEVDDHGTGGLYSDPAGSEFTPTDITLLSRAGNVDIISARDAGNYKLSVGSTGTLGFYSGSTLVKDLLSGGGGAPGGPTSSIQFNNAGNFSGSSEFVWNNTNTGLYIGQPTLTASAPLSIKHDDGNTYQQVMFQNTNAGTSASTDFVATADNGSDTTYYVDVGINSSGYADPAYSMAGPNDTYIYSVGGDIAVGTQTPGTTIKFHTGGTTSDKQRLEINDTGIAIPVLTSSAPAPSTGTLNVYSRNRAGRSFLEMRSAAVKGSALQPALFGNNVTMWLPGAGTTVSIAFGDTWTARNTTGAQATPALAATNLLTSMKRATFSSTTAGNTGAGIQTTAADFWRGSIAGAGGFFFFARFGIETTGSLSGSAAMIGLSTLNAVLGTQTPSTLSGDYACLTKDANESVWYFSTRNNSATTKTATGLNFNQNEVYDFSMYCPPSGSSITVRLVNETTDTVLMNNVEVTATLPRNTVFMYAHAHARHSGTAVIEALALNRIYVESDF